MWVLSEFAVKLRAPIAIARIAEYTMNKKIAKLLKKKIKKIACSLKIIHQKSRD